MGNRRVPERAEGRRGGPWPRSLARLMAVVALCALAFAVVLPRFGVPPAPRGRLRLAPRAVPIPTALASAPAASIDERIFIHAPDGIDDRMVVAAPQGIDDRMIVPADGFPRRQPAPGPSGSRVRPVPLPPSFYRAVPPLPFQPAPPPYDPPAPPPARRW